MAGRSKRLLFDDRHVRKYLRALDRDSKRMTIYAAASAKAAIPIRRSARKYAKQSMVGSHTPLARFQERVSALNKGRKNALPPRKKKTINMIRVRRGKRKHRGSAWIVGGSWANLVHGGKARTKTAESMGVKGIPIVLRGGEVIFVKKITTPKKNEFLKKAFRDNKSTTIRIFKAEVGKAVIKHAKKNKQIINRSAGIVRRRTI